MTDILRVKRRLTGAPGAPSALANSEIAYNEVDHTLYYGEGSSAGQATAIVAIAGTGMASNATPAVNGTASAGTATQWSRGDHVHGTDTSRAPLNSPGLTGTPTAPTVTPGTDNTTKIATTAFVQSAISAVSSGVTNITAGAGLTGGGSGAVTIAVATNGITNSLAAQMLNNTIKGNNSGATGNPLDLTTAQVMTMLGAAPLSSPALTNVPTAPTAVAGTSTTQIATTAFVMGQSFLTANQTITLSGDIAGSGTTAITTTLPTVNSNVGTFQGITVNGKGQVTAASNLSYATVNSPTFTGTPAGPTAAQNTNTTQLATTQFVLGQAATVAPLIDNSSAVVGVSFLYARQDHQHPTDTTRAALVSPTFTGTPSAPTPANTDNSTTLATTAFVRSMRLDQFAAPTASVAWNGQAITGLANPINPQDASTKFYVDSTIQGLTPKPTATVATTAPLPSNTYNNGTSGLGATLTATAVGTLTVDSHILAPGDIVLVKNETTAANNGLYTCTTNAAGVAYVLTRHVDMDASTEMAGAMVPVDNVGPLNANTLWMANPSTPVVVGTTAIPFTQMNSATSYVAGNGINIAGNTISAVGLAPSISVGASGIQIAAGYTGQSSITTLGTITAGVWNATTIAVTNGGTGATTLTGYVRGAGTAALTAVATIPNTDISGLGTMSTQNATAVAITGGTIDGVTIDGGTF